MNGVCTNIIHLDQKTLKYYGGNYDTFIKTKQELEENQEKRYQWEQDQIAHMKVSFKTIDSFDTAVPPLIPKTNINHSNKSSFVLF